MCTRLAAAGHIQACQKSSENSYQALRHDITPLNAMSPRRLTTVQTMRTSPYGVHTDYIFGGLTAKRNRLREAQIWLDPPPYYGYPKLLQVDLHVPAVPDNFERLRSDYMVELHLKVMQHQLDQVRLCLCR